MIKKLFKAILGSGHNGTPHTEADPGDESRHAITKAPAIDYNDQGSRFLAGGELDRAEQCYRLAIASDPGFAEAHNNLGFVLKQKGIFDQAAACYKSAIELQPDYAEPHYNLGDMLDDHGRLDEAIACYQKALALNPGYAKAYNSMGVTRYAQGKLDQAVFCYQQAITLDPGFAKAYNNLAAALHVQGKTDEAIACFRKALTINPDFAEAHCNLGGTLRERGRLAEAAEHCLKALSIRPDYAEAHGNLGSTYQALGDPEGAVKHYRKALSIKPNYAAAYDSLLFVHGYYASLNPHEYLSLARGWELACVPAQDRQLAHTRTFRRSPLSGRRLRVGYVSGDYRQHAVSYFIAQLFTRHDRTRVELFAYSANGKQDAVTARLQGLVEHWIPIMGIPDALAMDRIETDGIDVLVDLSGYTAYNRMGVFARRAAPVQVHYLGYFASTGLTEMDYFIGDDILTPREMDDHFSEQVWRLPRIRACYEGKADAPLPAWHPAGDGSIWVGSFNNLGKLAPATLALWAKILHALPEGRLLLKTKELADAGNRRRILDAMESHGIPSDRIDLQDGSTTADWRDHMAYYDRLDIALDPIGAHGGYTTTCDALWMGAPVIALEGDRMALRMAASILNAIGQPEWIARSEAEYVDKVVALARDVQQRTALRSGQRERMAASPVCDSKGLAVSLENAYLEMFSRWLDKQDKGA
jgi:protein O-GlcNAc transferase